MPSTSNNKNKKIVSEEKFETSIEESDVSGSEGDYVSWVSWYCNLKGHEFFCEVDDDYIQDDFNLCGLSGQVPYYDYALDLILDVESSHGDKLNEEQDSLVESSAEMLYGLIHARYILTSKGMSAMLEKYKNNEFGTCPRAYCCEQPCLPVGQSDIPRGSYVRIYCPKCEDIYLPRTRYQYEEEKDPTRVPTKHNIRMAMYWLVQGCQPGDSLVFHFSGHGSQQRNYNGDELDGFDETICPLDFETQGMIVDDEINATLVKPLPHGVKLHAIIDACHSGTVLDLPYLCRMDRTGRYVWEDHRPQSGAWKGTNGGEVISFSGCDDDQTSADTNALSKVTSTGAMTFSFIQAIERGHGIITYGDMLTAMRSTIRKTDNDLGGGSVVTSLLTMLLTGGILGEGMRQEPQLTANEPFDVYKKVFSI